ncbi:MAG: hypothetical protein IPK03_14585, partial [Bacteroidetes bacterium]|nr:hypothetical protein [Bacteroidota bacterium]
KAIDISKNKKHLKYLIPPALVLVFIIIAAPNIIKESTKHYVQYDTHFERKAPFDFIVKNADQLSTIQFADYPLNMSTKGSFEPKEVNINIDGYVYKMSNDSGHFNYVFKNVQKDIPFHFEANGYTSATFTLKVIPKPIIAGFEISLIYPAYTGLKNEVLKNIGDISVPIGTKATWKFNTEFVDALEIKFGGDKIQSKQTGERAFEHSKNLTQSTPYSIQVFNKKVKDFDSVQYSIQIIPDLHPTINVMEYKDSLNTALRYYSGELSDDYGIARLLFHYRIASRDTNGKETDKVFSRPVPFNGARNASFIHNISMKELNLQPGDELSYFFEVWDNDAVNGSKHTKSGIYTYKMPTIEQLEKQTDQNNKEIKKDLSASVKDAKKLQKEAQELREKLLEKKNLDWKDKQQIEKLLEKEKQMEKQVEQMKAEMKQNFEQQKEFKQEDQRILDKQKELQELMDQVLNPEMKDLYNQLEELMKQMDKEKVLEKLENMDMKNEKLEKELDKMLELFKNLEYQQKMDETADKLEKLAREQEKLAQETEKGITDELKKKQEELSKKMEDAKKEIEDLNKLNQEKNKGTEEDFKDIKKEAEDAQKNQEEAKDEMQKNNKEGASKKAETSR